MRYMKSDLTLILGCVLLLAGCSASSKKADDAGAEATPVPAEVTDDYTRFFTEGIRLERADGKAGGMYVRFGKDSLTAELFSPAEGVTETLERRITPAGKRVWNMEDDDTKNLRREDGGLWTVSRRGKLIFSEAGAADGLGNWLTERFEGTAAGARYQLAVRHREHSGDGHFLLHLTPAQTEAGNDTTLIYTGRRYTQRGTATDADATVWQLVADDGVTLYDFIPENRTLEQFNR